jgi:hypothetical protein
MVRCLLAIQDVRLEQQICQPLKQLSKECVLLERADNLDGDHPSPSLIPVDLEVGQALVVINEVRDCQIEDWLIDIKLAFSSLCDIVKL